jgi:hypothetical protein
LTAINSQSGFTKKLQQVSVNGDASGFPARAGDAGGHAAGKTRKYSRIVEQLKFAPAPGVCVVDGAASSTWLLKRLHLWPAEFRPERGICAASERIGQRRTADTPSVSRNTKKKRNPEGLR